MNSMRQSACLSLVGGAWCLSLAGSIKAQHEIFFGSDCL